MVSVLAVNLIAISINTYNTLSPGRAGFTTMGTINVTVANVRAYANDDSIRYRVSFKEKIDAIVKNADGEYVDGQVDYIDFVPSVLIAQCINQIEGLGFIYGSNKEQGLRNGNDAGFTAAHLTLIVAGATFELQRERFEEGEEYADMNGAVIGTHGHAGYSTDIVGITLTEKSQARIDKVLDKALGI